MPWNEYKPMDERLSFIARFLEGGKMAPLCREFGISRVTGHKLFNRYKDCGLDALNDRSRQPYRHANKLPFQVDGLVKRRKRRRRKAQGTALVAAHDANGPWCAVYKGEFMLGTEQYCYPLTIADYRSRTCCTE